MGAVTLARVLSTCKAQTFAFEGASIKKRPLTRKEQFIAGYHFIQCQILTHFSAGTQTLKLLRTFLGLVQQAKLSSLTNSFPVVFVVTLCRHHHNYYYHHHYNCRHPHRRFSYTRNSWRHSGALGTYRLQQDPQPNRLQSSS